MIFFFVRSSHIWLLFNFFFPYFSLFSGSGNSLALSDVNKTKSPHQMNVSTATKWRNLGASDGNFRKCVKGGGVVGGVPPPLWKPRFLENSGEGFVWEGKHWGFDSDIFENWVEERIPQISKLSLHIFNGGPGLSSVVDLWGFCLGVWRPSESLGEGSGNWRGLSGEGMGSNLLCVGVSVCWRDCCGGGGEV